MSEAHQSGDIPRTISLPDDLRAAVERALDQAPAARWTRAAHALSERYRAPREGQAGALAAGADDALGYAALILPAAYAQLRGAMAAAARRCPGWRPVTLLDLGSGPGTALWAAAAQWPSLRSSRAWEREPAFITLGRALAEQSESAAVRGARWERADLAQADAAAERFDLVVLGHVLNELAPPDRERVVERAWHMTGGLLLIVEPGTPAAFEVVRAARDRLLAAGAHTIAPCTHDGACPLQGDWCHFPQRIWRPEFQRKARGAPSPWEESKFSYAAMARFGQELPIWGRVIREPSSNKAYAEALVSAREGIVRHRSLKRHRDAFRRTKDLAWGEALEAPLEEL